MKKIINYLFAAIKKERILLTFIIIIFILGLVFGSLFINFVSNDDKTMLINQVTSYFNNISKLSDSVFGLYVAPCLVINTLIYIFMSFFALNAAIKFLKALFKKDSLNFKSFLGKYLLAFLTSLILISINTLIDSYLTPFLLKLFTFMT